MRTVVHVVRHGEVADCVRERCPVRPAVQVLEHTQPGARVRRITTADYRPDIRMLDRLDLRPRIVKQVEQLDLFAAPVSALTGEV